MKRKQILEDWGSLSKREFKRREMEHELGHEDEWERQKRRGYSSSYPSSRPPIAPSSNPAAGRAPIAPGAGQDYHLRNAATGKLLSKDGQPSVFSDERHARAVAAKLKFGKWEAVPAKGQGVAEGSKNQLPVVLYRELPDDQISGRESFQVVKSQSPYWKVGETFSDDDMSMGSRQVRFKSVKQGVGEGSSDAENELKRYLMQDLHDKVKSLNDMYVKAKKFGDTELMSKVKVALSKVSAKKSKLAQELGLSEESDENNDTFEPKSHAYMTTMKHAKNPTVQQRMAGHDMEQGIKGFRDRYDLLKDLERTGKVDDEDVDSQLQRLAHDPDHDAIYNALGRDDKLGQRLQDMANDISIDYGYHPDDDLEEIIARIADQLESKYGNEVDEAGEPLGTVAGTTPDGKEVIIKGPTGDTKVSADALSQGSDPKTLQMKKPMPKPGTPVVSTPEAVHRQQGANPMGQDELGSTHTQSTIGGDEDHDEITKLLIKRMRNLAGLT